MKGRFVLAAGCLLISVGGYAQLTLDYCIAKADANYPLIKRYGLVEKTKSIELSDVNKQWLPSVSAYTQASIQNDVPEFPAVLTDIMAQMGRDVRGLGKHQYKIGIDVSQTVWDGGASKARREISRAEMLEQLAALDVAMYAMRQRVMSLYFAALLTTEQIKQQQSAIALLDANLEKIEAMLRDGTAMRSDADNVKAQLLSARQKQTEAEYALKAYRMGLEIFIGESIDGITLEKPSAEMPSEMNSNRPELNLYNRRIALNQSRLAEINASVMPKFGVFAQAFYGYPGFNNFESMMNRNLTFNILAGIRATWSLSPLYTRSNTKRKIALANEAIEAERETFLFNNDINLKSQREEIEGLRKVVDTDREIIALRQSVRKAAEVQLDNGVIDTFTLLAKITDETQAAMTAAYHEIKLINAVYQLKYTLNR